MDFVLGIDGGGTKTCFLLSTVKGKYVNAYICGPSSIDTVSLDETEECFRQGIKMVTENFLNEKNKIVSCFAGLGGIANKEDAKIVTNVLKKFTELEDAYVEADSDIYNAYAAGLPKREGMAIIIGTGIVCLGKDKISQKEHRCGGISFQEGDCGAGFDLGKRGLRYLGKTLDGRLKPSGLTNELKEKFDIRNVKDLIKVFEKLYLRRTEMASLAVIILKHAEKDDIYALKIIDEATTEACELIKGVYQNIYVHPEIAVIGSVGNHYKYLEILTKKIKEIDEKIIVHGPFFPIALGSVILALEKISADYKFSLSDIARLK